MVSGRKEPILSPRGNQGRVHSAQMAKRLDNDSTMEVSSSQLVGDGKNRPAPHRQPGQDKNDVSMWIGGVVGADAFAGTAKPKKGRGLLIALLVVAVLAAGSAAVYFLILAKKDATPSPSAGSTPGSAAVMPAAPTMDAQPAMVPAATADAAPADAGVDAQDGALKADAISGLPEKPAGEKKATTKKPAVKKPATKTVKKPAPKKTTHH